MVLRSRDRRHLLIVAVVILALLLLLADNLSSARAQIQPADCTKYVAPDGSDSDPGTGGKPWRTLQHAIDQAEPGDMVCVGSGTYPTMNDTLILRRGGSLEMPLVITTYNGPVTIQGGVGFANGVENVHLYGFTITDYPIWGVVLGGNKDIVLSGLDISGGEAGVHFSISPDGEDAPVSDVLLRNSVIHDVAYTGIDCTPGPCNNMQFIDLEIYGAGHGTSDYGADGIAVESGQNITIEDCYIHDNSGDGIDLNSRDLGEGRDVGEIIVRRNRVEYNASNGIKLWHGGIVSDNVIWNSGSTALVLERGADYMIVNNTIANTRTHTYMALFGYDEVAGAEETTVTLYNNIFYNDNPAMSGTTLYTASVVALDAGNNLYFNPYRDADVICLGDEGGCFGFEQINDGTLFAFTGFGDGSIYADPLFVDAAAGDFHLSADSPARGMGSMDYMYAHDLDGVVRVEDAAPDSGAYMYVDTE